jgi:hypothetical protein
VIRFDADTMAPQAAGVPSRRRVERSAMPTVWSIASVYEFGIANPCTSGVKKAHHVGNLSTRRLSEASP